MKKIQVKSPLVPAAKPVYFWSCSVKGCPQTRRYQGEDLVMEPLKEVLEAQP